MLRELKPAGVKRPAGAGDATYWRFENSERRREHVHLMQAILESLGSQDFVVLTDQDATADAILRPNSPRVWLRRWLGRPAIQ